MRVAFLSGGKDSYYAVYRYGQVDLGLILIYDFPRPNPHLINLGKSLETLTLTGIPVTVLRLSKGREFLETVEFLRKLNVTTVVAGDVYID
ncbi:MAG: ATPase, partial [Desulfurococcaceae archaeon]|nr:ATPase [Desulfurococcaceae archaeon]